MSKLEKHLELIQSVISRMGNNSFLIKGWSITLVTGILALASANPVNSRISYLSVLIILSFWILDGYFLSQERKYRSLYNVVRLQEENSIDFDLNASKYKTKKNGWISSMFSVTLILFYAILTVLSVVIVLLTV